ncbi:uncharacterized protein ACRADG_000700 [Cochliomyia hominivorax]
MAGRHPIVMKNIRTSRGVVEYSIYDFIKEMKNKPVIWNRMHIDSKNAAILEKGWKDFSTKLVPFFKELDDDEQTVIVEEFKNYWYNLRKNLRSHLLLRRKGKTSHCHYLIHMEFFLETKRLSLKDVATEEELQQLLEFEIKKRAESGLPPPDISNIKDTARKAIASSSRKTSHTNVSKKPKIINVTAGNPDETLCNTSFNPISFCETTSQTSLGEDSVNEDVHTSSQQFDYRQQQKLTNVRIQNYAADNGFTNSFELPDQQNDAHQAFFDSIKPTLRKLNDHQKLDFKIQILKLLKKHNLY